MDKMSTQAHFQNLLNGAVQHLENLCTEWQSILKENAAAKSCPEEVLCEIMSSLGKTKLLLGSKLPQFRNLVEELSRGEHSQRPITIDDLRGFWDLVSIEISDVDEKFAKLTARRRIDWQPLPTEPAVAQPAKRKQRPRHRDKSDARKSKHESELHLRNAAKSRLAIAKARIQESVRNSNNAMSETNINGYYDITMD